MNLFLNFIFHKHFEILLVAEFGKVCSRQTGTARRQQPCVVLGGRRVQLERIVQGLNVCWGSANCIQWYTLGPVSTPKCRDPSKASNENLWAWDLSPYFCLAWIEDDDLLFCFWLKNTWKDICFESWYAGLLRLISLNFPLQLQQGLSASPRGITFTDTWTHGLPETFPIILDICSTSSVDQCGNWQKLAVRWADVCGTSAGPVMSAEHAGCK